MSERSALSLLRLLCTQGPQKMSAVDRAGVDLLIARGMASLVKRGAAVAATTNGYALHIQTAQPSLARHW